MAGIDYIERIPNNVNLAENRRLQRALEDWQPRFLEWWTEMGPSIADPRVYIVVSEWDTVEQVRAWEHVPEHEAAAKRWEPLYREPLVHRRFTPWVRPPEP